MVIVHKHTYGDTSGAILLQAMAWSRQPILACHHGASVECISLKMFIKAILKLIVKMSLLKLLLLRRANVFSPNRTYRLPLFCFVYTVLSIQCIPAMINSLFSPQFPAANLVPAGGPLTSPISEILNVPSWNMFNLCFCCSATVWYFLSKFGHTYRYDICYEYLNHNVVSVTISVVVRQ